MREKGEHQIPIFIQTAFPEQPGLDNWQQIGEEEAKVVYEMTLRNELSGGTPTVREFEKTWREWAGLDYAITTMNGSSALYSAYFGVGVGPGDEVICPTYTWICTIAPAVFLGARPVFVECGPKTLQMDPADIRKKITEKTKAIVVVHLWGNVCDLDAIMQISKETGIPVVEDCSHAHGAKWDGKITGSIGHVGAWSLQGSKALSAGEGGIMATSDPEIFERACLAGQVNRMGGIDLVTERYKALQPLGLGMKFRAHPLGIGIASVQFKKLPQLIKRRKAYVDKVEAFLKEVPGLEPVQVYEKAERGGYYAFPIIHNPNEHNGLSTQEFIQLLKNEGLNVSNSPYGLLHGLELFSKGFDIFTGNRGPLCGDYSGYKEGDFPVTEEVFRRLIFLPVLSDPVEGAAEQVIEMISKAVDKATKWN